MKQRISALDLQLLARELKQNLEGYRLSNIYNIADSSKQFLLRFNKPDSKLNVVVDCGLRIYLTEFSRPIPPTPSGFVVKLRKHLKAKRLTALKQVEQDRILVLQFADGHFYLVLEFFSAGNVILLDENRRIMSLQRVVLEHENRVGEVYEMFDESLFATDNENIKEYSESSKTEYTSNLVNEWIEAAQSKYESDAAVIKELNIESKKCSKEKKVRVHSIHKLLLSKVPHLSSDLLSKNLKVFDIDPSESCLALLGKTDTLAKLLNVTQSEYNELLSTSDSRGYILAKRNENFNPEKDSADLEFIFDTFHPFKPYISDPDNKYFSIVEIEGFYNKTLDKFFSTIESSKYALRIQNQESQAQKKIDDARAENNRKIQALLNVQESNESKGHLIIENASLIEEVKLAVQGLIDQQMDWSTIEKLIKSEQKKGNMIAQRINLPLNLKKNKISVKLDVSKDQEGTASSDEGNDSESSTSESSSDSDSDPEDSSDLRKKSAKNMKNKESINTLNVTIDLGLSAYANASEYFNIKKTSAEKQKKVEKNVGKAMKNIEVKIDQQLKKKLKESHSVLKRIRTPYFFEKYNWFISSEGFLVMMGKSPAETDQIFSKYIENDDIYMSNSFDTHVWIKNPERTEVPPNTLMQAGILCMSSSEAWSKKIASSPWWCFAKNVSKFDSSDNSVLPEGAFRLKNEKDQNPLPPAQLVMGFGFLWKVKINGNDEDEDEDEDEGVEEGENSDGEIIESLEDEDDNEDDTTNDSDFEFDSTGKEIETRNIGHTILSEIKSSKLENNETSNINDDVQSVSDELSVTTSVVDSMNRKVRGKKGKLKKIQRKYADQDEHERLLRLEALGTLKGIEKQQQKRKDELMKLELREDKKNRREKQKNLQALKFSKNEKAKVSYDRHMAELKPSLDKDDVVIDIVPVFAPWPALQKYKYKVKIQPGSAKKTKTLTEILHYFKSRQVDSSSNDKETDWPKEHEMIKSLKEQDLVLLLCVDKLKITIAGQKSTKNSGGSQKGKKSSKAGGKKRK
ncbi:RQC (ribosome quality control complex) component [Saccharomyces pastorianus]|uniref:Ribosome quality control complex subunit 2 n=1 Tax=Saccharomyces pastorianus TaxID=27292 RepID=A0A6C1EG78_SACPS|nr:RQC (ribosome quality control complex) component [Saccharomyces pastorianus]